MKCANCIYYENNICYRKGKRAFHSDMVCQYFVYENNNYEEDMLLK